MASGARLGPDQNGAPDDVSYYYYYMINMISNLPLLILIIIILLPNPWGSYTTIVESYCCSILRIDDGPKPHIPRS
jgi:hypothetical protein